MTLTTDHTAPADAGAARDLGALFAPEAVARITFVAAQHSEIAELEVNPLLCPTDGCEGLDARIVLAHTD